LEDPHRVLLGVFHKGNLVAMGHVFEVSKRQRLSHRGTLSLAVALPYEGRGIGSLLVETLIEESKKMKFEQIELTVVTENKVAIHIYEKYQFIPYGTLKRGMKNRDGSYWDLLHMVRDLEG
ncbi:MAG: GNAT family N-acetyltransferase, partial [Sphaerochaetaceae bacterium]